MAFYYFCWQLKWRHLSVFYLLRVQLRFELSLNFVFFFLQCSPASERCASPAPPPKPVKILTEHELNQLGAKIVQVSRCASSVNNRNVIFQCWTVYFNTIVSLSILLFLLSKFYQIHIFLTFTFINFTFLETASQCLSNILFFAS